MTDLVQLITAKRFPVFIPEGFKPTDVEADGVDLGPTGKVCPGYSAERLYRPTWGGGFLAPRGPHKLAHRAIDIMAAEGAHVVAPSRCIVSAVEATPKGGNNVHLKVFGPGSLGVVGPLLAIWYFAHMRDTPLVTPGQTLLPGEHIGFVGRTGNAVRKTKQGLRGCPHLHASLTVPNSKNRLELKKLGIAVNGDKVDTMPFLESSYPTWNEANV